MLKYLNSLLWNLNVVNDYWITVKQSGIVLLKVFNRWQMQYHPFFPLYVRCPSTILKVSHDFLKLPLFPLSIDISSGYIYF